MQVQDEVVNFVHFRVPDCGIEMKSKGKPKKKVLKQWSRKRKWLDDPLANHFKIKPYPKGGRTICTLSRVVKEDIVISTMGEATCSMSDNFVYSIGRAIALADAINKLEGLLNNAQD